MPRKPRQLESFSFRPDALSPVADRMTQLATAGDGWINLIPRMSEEDDDQPTSLGFMTVFGGGGPGVTMCTWIPGTKDHDAAAQSSLGIEHVTGHRAVNELAARNTSVPKSWTVQQDHPFRGLVLRIPSEESNEQVLAWALRAVRALGTPRPIRGWRADIYLPLAL